MRSRGDRAANLKRALELMEEAVERGAELVCFQELFLGDYFCQSQNEAVFELAEPCRGELSSVMAAHASRLGVVIVVPYFEKRGAGVYHNSALIIDADGTLLGNYRKMHVPDDPGFNEKYYFSPGDGGFQVWDTAVGRVGVLICWDQWFPEAARLAALGGAEILIYPTAIGWHPFEKAEVGQDQFDAWRVVQRSHAITNGCYVATVNRVGLEPSEGGDGIEFWGGSFVASPDGQIIRELSVSEEEVLVVEIDREKIGRTRIQWPFLRDRRIDAYAGLTSRFGNE